MTLLSKVTQMDRDPAVPALTYNKKSEYRNFMGGIFTVLLLLFAVWLIVSKGFNLIGRSEIKLSTFVKRDYTAVKIPSQNIMLALTRPTGQGDNKTYTMVPFEEYSRYGITPGLFLLNYSLSMSSSSSSQDSDDQYLPEALVKSRILENKRRSQSGFGADPITLYNMTLCRSSNPYLLCAKGFTEFKLQCSVIGTSSLQCRNVLELIFSLMPCSTSDPNCNKTFTPGLVPLLYLSDTQFDVFNATGSVFSPSTLVVNNLPNMLEIQVNKKYIYQIPVTRLLVETDNSVLPQALFSSINRTETYFFPFEDIELSTDNGIYTGYMMFRIFRSATSQQYFRSHPRVDEMLGQIFGLIGLLSLISTCLFAGYNRYLMDQHIRTSLDGDGGQEQLGYFRYVGRQLKGLFKGGSKDKAKSLDMVEIALAVKKMAREHGIEEMQYDKVEQDRRPEQLNQEDQSKKQGEQSKVGIFAESENGQIKVSLLSGQQKAPTE